MHLVAQLELRIASCWELMLGVAMTIDGALRVRMADGAGVSWRTTRQQLVVHCPGFAALCGLANGVLVPLRIAKWQDRDGVVAPLLQVASVAALRAK